MYEISRRSNISEREKFSNRAAESKLNNPKSFDNFIYSAKIITDMNTIFISLIKKRRKRVEKLNIYVNTKRWS